MEKVEKRLPHELDGLTFVEDSRSWEDRVKEWKRPMSFDRRMEWLHTNGHREGNGPEKVIFFIKLADRYGVRDFFPPSDGRRQIFTSRTGSLLTIPKMRKMICQKAFSILANTFLRQTKDYTAFPYVLPYTEPLFSELLWFFRPYDGLGGFDNLRPSDTDGLGKDGGDYYVSLAKNFANEFMFYAWGLLNNCWNKSWSTNPDARVVNGHEREIIMLMRRLGRENSMRGQFKPTAEVFDTMFSMLYEENFDTQVPPADLENKEFVGKTLEGLVRSGHSSFARFLYVVRLEVE